MNKMNPLEESVGDADVKMVLRLDLHDDKGKQKAMKAVSSLLGIDSISMDMKDKKMTVIGAVDPVVLVTKLRKSWHTEIISIGPAKEPKKEDKKDDPKKEDPKKEDSNKKQQEKKDEIKKEEIKKEEPKKEAKRDPSEQVAELVKMYKAYNPYMTAHYVVHSAEEDPNLCCIC